MLIINKHFNFCCFRALAYTTLDRLSAVFFYIIIYLFSVPHINDDLTNSVLALKTVVSQPQSLWAYLI